MIITLNSTLCKSHRLQFTDKVGLILSVPLVEVQCCADLELPESRYAGNLEREAETNILERA